MMPIITYEHLKFHFMISRNLIIGAIEVYRVALILARGSSVVVTQCTSDIRVTSYKPGTLYVYPQLNFQHLYLASMPLCMY